MAPSELNPPDRRSTFAIFRRPRGQHTHTRALSRLCSRLPPLGRCRIEFLGFYHKGDYPRHRVIVVRKSYFYFRTLVDLIAGTRGTSRLLPKEAQQVHSRNVANLSSGYNAIYCRPTRANLATFSRLLSRREARVVIQVEKFPGKTGH